MICLCRFEGGRGDDANIWKFLPKKIPVAQSQGTQEEK
jgi:hypothetical protein